MSRVKLQDGLDKLECIIYNTICMQVGSVIVNYLIQHTCHIRATEEEEQEGIKILLKKKLYGNARPLCQTNLDADKVQLHRRHHLLQH